MRPRAMIAPPLRARRARRARRRTGLEDARSVDDAHDRLAAVLAAQQSRERGGSAIEAGLEVLAVLELALPGPGAELADRLGEARLVIEDDEAFVPQPARQHQAFTA